MYTFLNSHSRRLQVLEHELLDRHRWWSDLYRWDEIERIECSFVTYGVTLLGLPPGVLLVTLDRGRQTVVPRGGTVLAAGDRIMLFAPPEQMAAGVEALIGVPLQHHAAPPRRISLPLEA